MDFKAFEESLTEEERAESVNPGWSDETLGRAVRAASGQLESEHAVRDGVFIMGAVNVLLGVIKQTNAGSIELNVKDKAGKDWKISIVGPDAVE